jgi:hypothetical protein
MSSSFSSNATPDAKGITIPSIQPHLVQPAKDAIKVINALAPAISAFRK